MEEEIRISNLITALSLCVSKRQVEDIFKCKEVVVSSKSIYVKDVLSYYKNPIPEIHVCYGADLSEYDSDVEKFINAWHDVVYIGSTNHFSREMYVSDSTYYDSTDGNNFKFFQ